MFRNEGRFGRLSDPRLCWSPPGIQPEAGAQGVRESTFVFSAVNLHVGTLDSLILSVANSGIISFFRTEVASRHVEEWILMVMNQAGWHIA
ncbi:MAG TPA: transposase [bacterium]|nr:transposase [bacterium]